MAVTTLDTTVISTQAKGPSAFSLAGLVDKFFTHLERRKAVAQLGAMTDRELMDLGLSRGSIEAAVYGRL